MKRESNCTGIVTRLGRGGGDEKKVQLYGDFSQD